MKRRAGTPPGRAPSPTKQAKAAAKSKGKAAAAAAPEVSPKKKAKKTTHEEPDKKIPKAAAKKKTEEEEERTQQKSAGERTRRAADRARKAEETEAERIRKAAEEKMEMEERARMAAEEKAERARKAAEEDAERRERTMMAAEESEIRRQAMIAAARIESGRVLATAHQQDVLAAQEAACLARVKEAGRKEAEVAALEMRQAEDNVSAAITAAEEAANNARELKEASEAAHQAALKAAAASALASKKADDLREQVQVKQLDASSAKTVADEKAEKAAANEQAEEDAARSKKNVDAQMADTLKGFCKTFELSAQFTDKAELMEAIQGFLDKAQALEEEQQRRREEQQQEAERRRAAAEAEAKKRKAAEAAEAQAETSKVAKCAQADSCPGCGTAYAEGALFCMFCGQKRIQARIEEHVQAVAEACVEADGATPDVPLSRDVSEVPEEPPAKVLQEASVAEASPDEPMKQVVSEDPENIPAKVAEEAAAAVSEAPEKVPAKVAQEASKGSPRRRSLIDALRQRGTLLNVVGITSPQSAVKEKSLEVESKSEEAAVEENASTTPAAVAERKEAPAEESSVNEQVPEETKPMAVDDAEETLEQAQQKNAANGANWQAIQAALEAAEAEASNEPTREPAEASAKDEQETEQPHDATELATADKQGRPVLCMVNGKWETETVFSPIRAGQQDVVSILADNEPAAEAAGAAKETPDEPMPQTVKEASDEPFAKKDEAKSTMLTPTPARAEAPLPEATEKTQAEVSEFAATATERQKELRQNIVEKKAALAAKKPEMQAAREVHEADTARIAAAEEAARPIEKQTKAELTTAIAEEKACKEEVAQVQQVFDNYKELRDNPGGKIQTRANALKKELKNLSVAKETADALPAILGKVKKKFTAKDKKALAAIDETLDQQSKAREVLKTKAIAKVKRCEEALANYAQDSKDRELELARSKATEEAKAQEIKAFEEAVVAAERELDNHEQLMTSKGLLRFSSAPQSCMVCCDDFEADETVMLGCSHGWYCKACMARFVEARLDSGIAGDVPCLSCSTSIPESDLVSLLPVKTILRLHARSIEQRAVASGALPRACPTPNCPMRQAVDENDPASARQKCLFCDKESCWLCGTQPYHEGYTCEEYREKTQAQRSEEEESIRQWMAATGTKQCPTCGMATSKENLEKQNEQRAECHKMMCRNCGTKFCFKCLTLLTDGYTCGCTRDAHGFIDPHTGKLVKHMKRARAS